MKILYLTDFLSPYRTVWMNLLSKEYEIDTYFFDASEKTREEKWLNSVKNEFKTFQLKSKNLFGIRFSKETFRLLKNSEYDIYIIDGYSSFVQVRAITKLAKQGKNVFVNVDGIDVWRKGGILSKLKWLIKSRIYKSGAKFLCGSKIAAERMIELGAKPENVFKHPFTTIYDSDIMSFEDKISRQDEFKVKIGAAGKKVALAAGRFIPLKRYEDLIKVWQYAKPDWMLYLIGSGELKDSYLKLIEDLSVKNIVIVDHLSREELDKYYTAADLFIHTSSTEVWGLIFNEAMSKGCPVISTNHCVGAVELIENGKDGYLIDVGDTDTLRKRIAEILNNDSLRQSMMQNSLKKISGYTYENLVLTHLDIFKASLNCKKPENRHISILKRYCCAIIQKFVSLFLRLQKREISMLMFHRVSDETDENDTLNIKTTSFCELIDGLKKKNTVFAPVDDIFKPGKKTIISFDDTYKSAIQNAIPYLEKKNIPYVLFIADSMVDTEGLITSAQIAELSKSPLCTIGFHTKDHLFMRNLSKMECENQLDCSTFEQKHSINCDFFAFPYGSVAACAFKNIKALRKTKYKAAFSTISSTASVRFCKKHPFFIPRIAVSEKNWKSFLK